MPVAQLASRLSPRGWLIAGASALGAILFIYLFVHMVSKPSYSTLASGLNPAQTAKMTGALDQQGIGYQLQNNGTALAVQSNETAHARVALASAGVLGGNHPNLSLFEKQNLGESNFQQQVNYQRAMQGQLEETIDNVQGVSSAQVQLVLPSPQAQLFASSQTTASASVLLSGTNSLDPGSVRGIAQLVASAVPGLSLSKVTITDGTGQLLWPAAGSEGGGAGETTKQASEARYDASTAANLNAMLAQTLGPGKAQVQVAAALNVNKTTQETLTYGKAGVPLQQSKDLETLAGNGSGGGAATGTANIPAYAQTGAGGKSNYKHEITNTSLGVDKTVTHSTVAPGEIENQHVSVLLDRSVPAASLPAIREAITNAAGLQPKRGDTISIGQMAFAKPAAPSASPTQRHHRIRQVCADRSRVAALPVLHHPLAAQARAGGHRQRTGMAARAGDARAPLRARARNVGPRSPSGVGAPNYGDGRRRRAGAPACGATRREQPRSCRPAAAHLDAGGFIGGDRAARRRGVPCARGAAQRSVVRLPGRRKAAVLMAALGSERAAGVMQHMREEDIEGLSLEMAKLAPSKKRPRRRSSMSSPP